MFLSSCKKEDENPSTDYSAILQDGKEWIFFEQSTIQNVVSNSESESYVRWQLMKLPANATASERYRVNEQTSPTLAAAAWQLRSQFELSVVNNDLVFTREGSSEIWWRNGLTSSSTWNGNAFGSGSAVKTFSVEYVGQLFSAMVDGKSISKTNMTKVKRDDIDNIVIKRQSHHVMNLSEGFAEIYEESVDYCTDTDICTPGVSVDQAFKRRLVVGE